MIRYDPTKEEHKVFEINKIEDLKTAKKKVNKDTVSKKIADDDHDEDVVDDKMNVTNNNDSTRFYDISNDITNLFCKNEVFQFKFSNKNEKSSDEDEEQQQQDSDDDKNFKNYRQIKRSFDYLNENNYESSLSSEDDEKNKKTTLPKKNDFAKLERFDEFFPDVDEVKLQGIFLFFFKLTDFSLVLYFKRL
jgi:hypothetical protein